MSVPGADMLRELEARTAYLRSLVASRTACADEITKQQQRLAGIDKLIRAFERGDKVDPGEAEALLGKKAPPPAAAAKKRRSRTELREGIQARRKLILEFVTANPRCTFEDVLVKTGIRAKLRGLGERFLRTDLSALLSESLIVEISDGVYVARG